MPQIVIPMHYKRKHCELDIDKVDPFVRMFDDEYVEDDVVELELDRQDFDENGETRLVVLKKN